MNKKVFIKQDGSIPGYRIQEELNSRGAKDSYGWAFDLRRNYYYLDDEGGVCMSSYEEPISDYTELLYNKETDSFYEKDSNPSNTGKKECSLMNGENSLYNPVGVLANKNIIENKTPVEIPIPEGYEAKIEDGKVIFSKKHWQPKVGDSCYSVELYADTLAFTVTTFEIEDANDLDFYKRGTLFPTEDQAHAFCRKLNNAIRQVAEERRKEVEG